MGLVVKFKPKNGVSNLRSWYLNYALRRKMSEVEGERYLKKSIPPQLWYQVQRMYKEQGSV